MIGFLVKMYIGQIDDSIYIYPPIDIFDNISEKIFSYFFNDNNPEQSSSISGNDPSEPLTMTQVPKR